jgi:hypothetical protein
MLRQVIRMVCVLLLSQGQFGCAIVDQFSGRAVEYNLEAEQAQEQALLLNIIRASLRRPMQFTSLQSITGTASASGSITGAATGTKQTPYVQLMGLPIAAAAGTNSAISRILGGTTGATASMSGGPTFVVPVLDTQEFYQGILTPIPLQAFDYYLQQGFPPELLFDLFVVKVVVTRLDDGTCRQFSFQNSVRDDLQFGQFQAFTDYLIGSGLSAERVNSVTPFGPPIPRPATETASHEEAAKVVEAYSKAASAGLDIREEGSGENTSYRLQKRNSIFRFCFAYPGGSPSDWIGRPDSAMFCGNFNRRLQARGQVRSPTSPADGVPDCVPRPRGPRAEPANAEEFGSRSQGIHTDGSAEFRGIRLSPEFLQRIDAFQSEQMENRSIPEDALFHPRDFAGAVVSLKVYTRSTEGILYYLGEITRRRLFTEFGDKPRTIQIKTGIRYSTMPRSECDDAENGASWQSKTDMVYLARRRSGGDPSGSYYCENVFVLETEPALPGEHVLSVSYDGKNFGLPRDSNRAGRTLQVLELVKQLLALNTSAKQLPATSIISVSTP